MEDPRERIRRIVASLKAKHDQARRMNAGLVSPPGISDDEVFLIEAFERLLSAPEGELIRLCVDVLRSMGDSRGDWTRRKKVFREAAEGRRKKDGRPRKLSAAEERDIWCAFRVSPQLPERHLIWDFDWRKGPIRREPVWWSPDDPTLTSIAKRFGITRQDVARILKKWDAIYLGERTKPSGNS